MKNAAMGRWIGLALCGGMLMGLAACHKNAPSEQKQSEKAMWNGGKQQAPVRITSDVRGEVAEEVELPLVIRVQPERPCAGLVTEVYGTDGVVVQGERTQRHERCDVAGPGEHRVRVKIPRGGSGLVVAQVKLEIDGRSVSATQVFPVHAKGAQPKERAIGTLEEDAQGNPVRVMKSR